MGRDCEEWLLCSRNFVLAMNSFGGWVHGLVELQALRGISSHIETPPQVARRGVALICVQSQPESVKVGPVNEVPWHGFEWCIWEKGSYGWVFLWACTERLKV